MRRRTILLAIAVALVVAAVLAQGCASRRQRAEDAKILDAEALYRKGVREISLGNLRRARVFLDRIQYTAENRTNLEPKVRLALADVAFYTGDDLSLIDARAKYVDFVTLYGDHPRAPYAQLQAGVCSLKQVSRPMRDQSQTLVAMQDLREVERRYPLSPFVRAARDLLSKAESNLAEHDYRVGLFYLKRKAYLAAADRFRWVLDHYPTYTRKESVYFHLGQSLLELDNVAEAKIYLDKIVRDYPEGEYAVEARRLLARANGSETGSKRGSS